MEIQGSIGLWPILYLPSSSGFSPSAIPLLMLRGAKSFNCVFLCWCPKKLPLGLDSGHLGKSPTDTTSRYWHMEFDQQ